jgi:hypothetical protein
MPTNLKILNKADVRNIVYNELRKKDKLISIGEVKILIKQEIIKQNKDLYNQLNKLRKKIIKEE